VTLDLGGPGVGCSAMRVRRLLADELAGPEREKTQTHVDGCSRCQKTIRELHEESVAVRRDLPFPAFAAGVAEKLARQRRPRFAQWTAFAAAAAALIVAGAVVLRTDDGGQAMQRERSKGGSIAQLFVQDGQGTRAMAAGEMSPMVRSCGSSSIRARANMQRRFCSSRARPASCTTARH
jgi:hypothetical protein